MTEKQDSTKANPPIYIDQRNLTHGHMQIIGQSTRYDENTIKKKRQGQTKPDGTKSTPKPLCLKCGEYLKRCYTREMVDGKQRFVKSGWMCPSSTCDYIVKDFVELTEEPESFSEMESD